MIVHADMDAFYASVEQRDRPELRGQPVIVGGTGSRGVVAAASYEARVFGVHSAMPTVHARRLCPRAHFLTGRMDAYTAVSKQIRAVFEEFTPIVEPLSLDEAFLDVHGSIRLFGSALEIGRKLKQRVREQTDLAVSVGIAPSKMVAKIASDLGKPDGLLLVHGDEVQSFLAPLPIRRIWGIGPRAAAALEGVGLCTIGDLAQAETATIDRALPGHGAGLRELARGNDQRRVVAGGRRKSYGEENTFARDLTDCEDLRATIASHAEAIARRLRSDGRRARTVTLKFRRAERVEPGRYPLVTRRSTLQRATDDGRTISREALELWASAHRGVRVRLVGVSVSGLDEEGANQLSLFESAVDTRSRALHDAMDSIVERHGTRALRRGGAIVERAAPSRTDKEIGSKSSAPRDGLPGSRAGVARPGDPLENP